MPREADAAQSAARSNWPCPIRIGVPFANGDDQEGTYAEYVRADLYDDPEVVLLAAQALHDHDPWIYGQDAGGEDIVKPWDEAPQSVQAHYREAAVGVLRVVGGLR